ncbi:Vacuolar protein sorting-associated protein [Paramyrothecium foliicola]|nr:Vacuolar protein sorting-associated protein [Paramyrothecium foliicola]
MELPYAQTVRSQLPRHPCLANLLTLLCQLGPDVGETRAAVLHVDSTTRKASVKDRGPHVISDAIRVFTTKPDSAQKQTREGHLLLIENIDRRTISKLGCELSVDPLFFASHVHSPWRNMLAATPSHSELPSMRRGRSFASFNYHRIYIFPNLDDGDSKLLRRSNIRRKVYVLPSMQGKRLGIAQHCCSVLVLTRGRSWVGIILTDSALDGSFISLRKGQEVPIFTSFQPLLGGTEDFGPTTQANLPERDSASQSTAAPMFDELIRHWCLGGVLRNILIDTQPFPFVLYYPMRLVAAEWVNYTAAMCFSMKQYQVSPSNISYGDLELIASAHYALDSWSRRVLSSKAHIGAAIWLLRNQEQAINDDDDWKALLEDFECIRATLTEHAAQVENVASLVYSHIHLAEARRAFAEAQNPLLQVESRLKEEHTSFAITSTMAEPIPEALKKPEISRFINRANQVRNFKPAISYWCEYHAVNQIVSKGLHNTDDDAFNFTRTLIERLESTKAEHADNDAIIDNTAGQAYVEQFAQDTFDRAERTLRANKVTRQTADTFDAAATFFDLLHAWGAPEPEVLQKIKFAKWNAARIIRAIREGKDPNESNPKLPEPEVEPDQPLDLQDELVASPGGGVPTGPQPAQVEEVPDAGEPQRPTISTSEPPQPSPSHDGYFPSPTDGVHPEPFAPSPLSHSPTGTTPGGQAPPPDFTSGPTAGQPPFPPPPQPFTSNVPFHSPNPDPSAPPSWTTTPSVPHPAASNPPPAMPGPAVPQVFTPPPPAPAPVAAPVPPPTSAATDVASVTDSMASLKDIAQAQKHAKWAISALNFEDVPTAIRELRKALATLGAQ